MFLKLIISINQRLEKNYDNHLLLKQIIKLNQKLFKVFLGFCENKDIYVCSEIWDKTFNLPIYDTKNHKKNDSVVVSDFSDYIVTPYRLANCLLVKTKNHKIFPGRTREVLSKELLQLIKGTVFFLFLFKFSQPNLYFNQPISEICINLYIRFIIFF